MGYTLEELKKSKPTLKKPNLNGVILGTYKSAFNDQLVDLIALFRGNEKIGSDFIQLSILPSDLSAEISTKEKGRFSICGNCPHHLINSCYAYDQGLFVMRSEHKKGKYKRMAMAEFLSIAKNSNVRFGRFGDLSLIPFDVVNEIAKVVKGFTGYTNQWRSSFYDPRFNDLFMLSTIGQKDTDKALQKFPDSRVFIVARSDSKQVQKGAMSCPSSRGFTCDECLLCDGKTAKVGAVNIQINAHGISYKTKNINKLLKSEA